MDRLADFAGKAARLYKALCQLVGHEPTGRRSAAGAVRPPGDRGR